ncbi:aconitase X swivel domain-containing protein [Chloroflexota bacterium]
MQEKILKGHKVVKGKASGEALVSNQPFCFSQNVDIRSGVVVEKGNEWEGISIAGKILVFPIGKGSSGTSEFLYQLALCGTQPGGIINLRADPVIVVGAILGDIPMVDRLDGNPLQLIRTGDHVELDADNGIVRVGSREPET